jgi:hypothetical protein
MSAVSIRLSIASIGAAAQPAVRTGLRILEKPFASRADESKHPIEPVTGFGGIAEMEHSKLANGNGHGVRIGRSASPALQDQMSTERSTGKKAVRKKMASSETKFSRPRRKEMDSESKSKRLVCRYCGSEDLAPSFIKRRDRRCRKCFSKRYGSAARARKAKVKR